MDNPHETFKEQLNELEKYLSDNTEDFDFDELIKEHGIDIKELTEHFTNYSPQLELGYTILRDGVIEPKYNYSSDSGFDLHSTEDLTIPPFGRVLVPTGLSFDIKDGYEIQVRSKSGLAIKQGLMVLNSPGTVDNGYTGEVQVIVFNTNNHEIQITKGMKVGQAVLCPVVNGKWVNLTNKQINTSKDRGSNGFGSTGI